MKIIQDRKAGRLTLVPVTPTEKDVISKIATISKSGDKLRYGGREDRGEFCAVILHVSAKPVTRKQVSGSVTVIRHGYEGGIKLVLEGTSVNDKYAVNGIRNTCYFGTGGAIFLETTKVKGKTAIVLTFTYCKVCKKPVIDTTSCEWKVCDSCAKKCTHEYETGLVHGGPAGSAGIGEFCGNCGRGNPKMKCEKVLA